MQDNIGNEINIGDTVFCYSGSLKNTIQIVVGTRNIKEHWGIREAVSFDNGVWLSNYNVLSLNALGIDISTIGSSAAQCDALGNSLHIGDRVLYLHAMEMYAEVGIVKSLAAKSCLLSIECNRFGREEYRKRYDELISLTALGVENIPKRNRSGDIIE